MGVDNPDAKRITNENRRAISIFIGSVVRFDCTGTEQLAVHALDGKDCFRRSDIRGYQGYQGYQVVRSHRSRLELAEEVWEIPIMKIGTTDQEKRIRLAGATPKEKFWIIKEPGGYCLKRIVEPGRRLSRTEVVRRINRSKLVFTRDWDEIRKDMREP